MLLFLKVRNNKFILVHSKSLLSPLWSLLALFFRVREAALFSFFVV